MILIDAVFINNGGGKVLLDYLLLSLNQAKIDYYCLLDNRVIKNTYGLDSSRVSYIKGSLLKRHFFYLRNRNRFSRVFCFGNLPPSITLSVEVITYFHQPMYLDIPSEYSLTERIKFHLKVFILNGIKKNNDLWLVQSDLIKMKMELKFNLKSGSVRVLPFYPQFDNSDDFVSRHSNTFLYVSNANPHKNHLRLISAFCRFYDRYGLGKLILTVSNEFTEVIELIESSNLKGYPIENVGFVDRLTLRRQYLSSEFLIFPSMTESFGLGLIEAIECGCKVVSSDLPYTYEICEPTLSFNPLVEQSMYLAFVKCLDKDNLKPSTPKIKNNINSLIALLKS